ncbi:hypothetical protein CDL12_05616 [Handroanthus impetiginosus]|uniref:BHLH domain-containing protein n=1 Tax=Handroanthus impetiginosus TaxID=429701 RepID=A0A2G9HWJ1_9LAMI|nr:hypothetical protein CDL12_05616 [Handroanthus impetiginosus]
MESASSIHHHQLQDHLLGSSSSCYGLIGSTAHDYTASSILNANGFTSYPNETILNPRLSSNYSFMAPDFHWANTTAGSLATQDLQLQSMRNTREEFSDHFYLKYTDSISSLNQVGLTYPGSSDMNLQPLDHLPSSRFRGKFSPISSQNQIGFAKDVFSYSLNDMQQSYLMPPYAFNKISDNGRSAEAKRSSTKMEPNAIQNATKKSRLEGRASCPPFKVRKEKLGDRIAALQQLVAPFGKTDTASVLMEAIGYIKFLQTQVQTLSVPYMKRSWKKTTRLMKADRTGNEDEDQKHDLKSRGLCLVPLSCMSYITDGGGGVVWPPSQFGGAA